MRVLLVANSEVDEQESMRRYATWLQNALIMRGYQVEVVAPKPVFSRMAPGPTLKKYLGYLDKFLIFPFLLRRLAQTCDLAHVIDHSNSMYLRHVRSVPSLITCHDLLAIRAARGDFAQMRVGWSGRLLQRWILSGLLDARDILCVSAKTAKDLGALTRDLTKNDKGSHRVRVVPHALNWSYRPGAPIPAKLITRLGLQADDRYFVHVGGNNWYKNRVGVLGIFARLIERDAFSSARLILVGKTWTEEMLDVIREERIEGRVIQAVGVSNEELQALYGNSLALLFPSLEEGFGWPIIEAQACGCPVITSSREPMSEVAGDGAIFIDPINPTAASEIIVAGLKDSQKLRAAGFRNLARFSDAAITDQYCAYYEEIISRASPSKSLRG